MYNQQFLRQIREHEARLILPFLPQNCLLLEIGAGSGWQAKIFSEAGVKVVAIELMDSIYLSNKDFPLIMYDGRGLPFEDHAFDIVFTSNVIEHIPGIGFFLEEIRRILKVGGNAIHILPTSNWRMWTNIAHYPYLVKRFFDFGINKSERFVNALVRKDNEEVHINDLQNRNLNISKELIFRSLVPENHGVYGNFLTQTYYFSKTYWREIFKKSGFTIKAEYPNRLFYTGYGFFGSVLGLEIRNSLSYVLGSVCCIYILGNQIRE